MPKLSPPTGDRGKMVLSQRTLIFEDQVVGVKAIVKDGKFKTSADVYRFALDLVIYGRIPDRKSEGVPLALIEKAMADFQKRISKK